MLHMTSYRRGHTWFFHIIQPQTLPLNSQSRGDDVSTAHLYRYISGVNPANDMASMTPFVRQPIRLRESGDSARGGEDSARGVGNPARGLSYRYRGWNQL